jgi:hypothetical protein
MKRRRARCLWCNRSISVSDLMGEYDPDTQRTRMTGKLREHSGNVQFCPGSHQRHEVMRLDDEQ